MNHDEFPAEHHAYVAFRSEAGARPNFPAGQRVYSTPIGDRHNASEITIRHHVADMVKRNERIAPTVLIARYELVEVKEVKIILSDTDDRTESS